MLAATVDRVAAEYEDLLAPAIAHVWRDEIDGIRADLLEWVRQMARAGDNWEPEYFEFAFGLGGDIGAKTGSAEIDGQAKTNAWFTAYRDDMAAAAVVTAGGHGGDAAGPVVRQVLDAR